MDAIAFVVIVVSGEDAQQFLQGQFTCDMTHVTERPSFGAYCDGKGRVLANFWIAKIKDAYQICLPDSVSQPVLDTLKKYAIFSKVVLTKQPVDAAVLNIETSRLYYINQRIAFIFAKTSLLFTPQMIGWELLGGVSFKKGCYLGQEVVARTQHLGKLKRHLHPFSCAGEVMVNPGDDILRDQEAGVVGVVCDAVAANGKTVGLAVIQDQACDGVLTVAGAKLVLGPDRPAF